MTCNHHACEKTTRGRAFCPVHRVEEMFGEGETLTGGEAHDLRKAEEERAEVDYYDGP